MAASTVSITWLVAYALVRGGLCTPEAPVPGPMLAAMLGSTLVQLDIRSESEKMMEIVAEAPGNGNASRHQGSLQRMHARGCADSPLPASVRQTWTQLLGKTVDSCTDLAVADCKSLVGSSDHEIQSMAKEECSLTCHACNTATSEARRAVPEDRRAGAFKGSVSCGGSYAASGHSDTWEYTATEGDGFYTFDTCGSSFDTYVYMYASDGSQIYACDDCGSCGLQTVATAYLTQGETYTIQVSGYMGAGGAYNLGVTCPPTPPTGERLCGILTPVASGNCPSDDDLMTMPTCDLVAYGQVCRVSWMGECGLDYMLGNCGWAAVYLKTSSAPTTTAPSTGGTAKVYGDPHFVNMFGQRFDLMVPGKHNMLSIPRGELRAESILLKADIDTKRVGAACGEIYIKEINVTGLWASRVHDGGMCFDAENPQEIPWMSVGDIDLKVVWGHTRDGVLYLNMAVRHLSQISLPIGGLLGSDDHTLEMTPDSACARIISLGQLQDQDNGITTE